MKILTNFLIFMFGLHLYKFDVETDLTEQLKELMPTLINAKAFFDKGEDSFKSTTENVDAIKELKEQFKNIDGSITKLDKGIFTLGKKAIQVQPTGMTKEQKIDFAKFFISVGKAGKGMNGDVITDIKSITAKYMGDDAAEKALNIGTGSAGGFLVPEPFFAEIFNVAQQASIYLQRARRTPITIGNKLLDISLATDVSVFFTDEAASITESNPVFAQDDVSLKKLAAFSKWSNELAEDEEVGLVDFIASRFGGDMGAKIDLEGFDGDGTNFTGILQKSGVNTVTMPTGKTSFGDITEQFLSDMIAQLTGSLLPGAAFYMHRTIFNVIRKLTDSQGAPIYAPASAEQPSTIYGFPFVLVDQMPALSASAVSTNFVVFGNLQNASWGDKGEMTVKVTDIPEILTDQTIMVVRRRIATNVSLPAGFSVLKTAAS